MQNSKCIVVILSLPPGAWLLESLPMFALDMCSFVGQKTNGGGEQQALSFSSPPWPATMLPLSTQNLFPPSFCSLLPLLSLSPPLPRSLSVLHRHMAFFPIAGCLYHPAVALLPLYILSLFSTSHTPPYPASDRFTEWLRTCAERREQWILHTPQTMA